MDAPFVLAEFLSWHYTIGLAKILEAWGNLQWHFFHYFSIPLLARSFFAPFHRMQEIKKRGFDPHNLLEVVIINTAMRFVGIVVRSVFILLGLLAELAVFIGGAIFFLFALLAPAVAATFIFFGLFEVVTGVL